ncbi:GtrA family protein [bacterium]|nr:GtrA family protein [bacterium]
MSEDTKIASKIWFKQHSKRFFRFGIVGGIGVVVNMGFYALLYDVVGLYDMLAGAIAIELSIINNFVLNERWTFRDRAVKSWKVWFQRCFAFHLSSGLVAMLAQLLTLYILTRSFHLWDKLAYLIGIILGALANYFICSKLIFRDSKPDPI